MICAKGFDPPSSRFQNERSDQAELRADDAAKRSRTASDEVRSLASFLQVAAYCARGELHPVIWLRRPGLGSTGERRHSRIANEEWAVVELHHARRVISSVLRFGADGP